MPLQFLFYTHTHYPFMLRSLKNLIILISPISHSYSLEFLPWPLPTTPSSLSLLPTWTMVVRPVLVLLPVPSTTPISFFFGVYAPAPSSLLSTTLLSYPGPPTSLLALLHRFFLPLSTMVASFASTRVSIFSGPIPTVLATTTTRSVTTSTTHKNTLIKTHS